MSSVQFLVVILAMSASARPSSVSSAENFLRTLLDNLMESGGVENEGTNISRVIVMSFKGPGAEI